MGSIVTDITMCIYSTRRQISAITARIKLPSTIFADFVCKKTNTYHCMHTPYNLP